MITKFDSKSTTQVRMEVDEVLGKLGKELGVNFKLGSLRYDHNTFTLKVEGSITGFDTLADDWDKHYWKFDLKKEWLHMTFQHSGETYKVVGLRPKARKQTVLVEKDGKTFQINHTYLQTKLPMGEVA